MDNNALHTEPFLGRASVSYLLYGPGERGRYAAWRTYCKPLNASSNLRHWTRSCSRPTTNLQPSSLIGFVAGLKTTSRLARRFQTDKLFRSDTRSFAAMLNPKLCVLNRHNLTRCLFVGTPIWLQYSRFLAGTNTFLNRSPLIQISQCLDRLRLSEKTSTNSQCLATALMPQIQMILAGSLGQRWTMPTTMTPTNSRRSHSTNQCYPFHTWFPIFQCRLVVK